MVLSIPSFVRLSVLSFVRSSINNLWSCFDNESISMQIGINLPPGHERSTSGVRSSNHKVTQGRTYIWNPGGDIIHDPSTQADRRMQWAMEVLSLKGGGSVAHSILTAPPRIADMRLADALVIKLLIYQQVHFPQHCSLEWEYSWESGEAVGCKRKKYPDFAFHRQDKGRCNVQFQVQFQQIYWPHVLFIVWRCIPGLSPLQVVQNPTSQHWLLGDNPATQSIAVQPPVLLHSARHSSTVVAAEDRSPKPP